MGEEKKGENARSPLSLELREKDREEINVGRKKMRMGINGGTGVRILVTLVM